MQKAVFTPEAGMWVGIFLSGYALILTGLTVFAARKVRNFADYLVAGRSLPFFLCTATLLATWFGAGSSMGVAGAVCKKGLYGVTADPFGASLALLLGGLFYVKYLRAKASYTITDIIEERYGKKASIYASFFLLPTYTGWLGALILAMGKILSLLLGWEPLPCSLVIGAVILLYTLFGGMWAVTLTDAFQILLILLGFLLLLPEVAARLPGGLAFVKEIPAKDFSLLPSPPDSWEMWTSCFGQWIVMGLGCIVGQDLFQRTLSAKTPEIARKSTLYSALFYFLLTLFPIFFGFSARFLPWKELLPPHLVLENGLLKDPEQILPLLAGTLLSPIPAALFLTSLLAVIMSSADSSVLAVSSLFVNNIVRPLCKKELPDKKSLLLVRLSGAGFLVLGVVLALHAKSIFTLLVNSWACQLLVLFVPVTCAIYFPKTSLKGIWCGMTAGPLVWFFYAAIRCGFSLEKLGDDILYQGAFFGFLAACLLTFLWPGKKKPETE